MNFPNIANPVFLKPVRIHFNGKARTITWWLFLVLVILQISCDTSSKMNTQNPKNQSPTYCESSIAVIADHDIFSIDHFDAMLGELDEIRDPEFLHAFSEYYDSLEMEYRLFYLGRLESNNPEICSALFYLKAEVGEWFKQLVAVNFLAKGIDSDIISLAVLSESVEIPMSYRNSYSRLLKPTVFEKIVSCTEVYFDEQTDEYFHIVDTLRNVLQIDSGGRFSIIRSDSISHYRLEGVPY